MSEENISQELERRYRATALIILAQIFTIIALVAVAWFVIPLDVGAISGQTVTILWVTILFLALGAFVLRRVIFAWERLKNIAILKGLAGLLNALQTNTIILAALGEVVGALGFIVSILSGNRMEMLRAGAIALIIFLINFPRKSVWKKIVAGLENKLI